MKNIKKPLRIASLLAIALFVNACAPALTSVVVRTDPPGGQVVVSDQQVTDGNSVQLLPGNWDFVSTLSGYRDGHVTAEVKSEPGNVTVPLGMPFGRLAVAVSPADAGISVDSGTLKRGPELHVELDPGPHDLTFTHPDYPRVTRSVEIVTGEEVSVQVEMADTAPLTITTNDKQAVIYVDGNRAGQGEQATVAVSQGTHDVSVVHTLNDWQRRYAKRRVSIEHESGVAITIFPETEQWLFEGQWLQSTDARNREQQRFNRQAVTDTAITHITLGPQVADDLRHSDVLPVILHYAMRVGDQVVLTDDQNQWVFTKRNASMGEAFKALGNAFKQSRTLTLPWDSPEPLYELNAQINRQPAVTLATAVVRTRLALPLVKLEGDELNGNELTVTRNLSDGPLMVVASGGEDLEANGERLSNAGLEKALQLAAGSSPVVIKWSTKPEAVTVIATRKLNQLDWRSWESLLRGDKRLGAAFHAGQVKKVERVSQGPEYPETATELFEAVGPLAAEMNLHMIDLGPHNVAGDYQRSWRFVLNADGTTQRQLDLRYQVSTESLDTDTRNFLRHDPGTKD